MWPSSRGSRTGPVRLDDVGCRVPARVLCSFPQQSVAAQGQEHRILVWASRAQPVWHDGKCLSKNNVQWFQATQMNL
jgi:hypothetical protein